MDKNEVFDMLRGQQLPIPNLSPMFEHWPRSRNKHYKALIPVVDKRLGELINDQIKLEKLKKADFALFASSWWPSADFKELCMVAYLAIWLFLWDDELDDPTGSLTDDFEGSQSYRSKTTQFCHQSLGLVDHGLVASDLYIFISSFEPIGKALRETGGIPPVSRT